MQNGKKKLFGIVTLNKYGNPFRRKLFIFFMLLIPIANFWCLRYTRIWAESCSPFIR